MINQTGPIGVRRRFFGQVCAIFGVSVFLVFLSCPVWASGVLEQKFAEAPWFFETKKWVRLALRPYPFLFTPLKILVAIEADALLGDQPIGEADADFEFNLIYTEISNYLAIKGLWLGMTDAEIAESLRNGNAVLPTGQSAIEALDISLQSRNDLIALGFKTIEEVMHAQRSELNEETLLAVENLGKPKSGFLRELKVGALSLTRLSEVGIVKVDQLKTWTRQDLWKVLPKKAAGMLIAELKLQDVNIPDACDNRLK